MASKRQVSLPILAVCEALLPYAILSNPVYVGQIRHKNAIYEGRHAAIIDREVWEQVRASLTNNTRGTQSGASTGVPSPLAGRVFDEIGEPLVATHACKGSVRYRYYVSRALHRGTRAERDGIRMPALALEKAVSAELAKQFDQPLLLAATAGLATEPDRLRGLDSTCKRAAEDLRNGSAPSLRRLISRMMVGREKIVVEVSTSGVASHLGTTLQSSTPPHLTLVIDARLRRSGRAVRLVERSGKVVGTTEPQQHLARIMHLAQVWWEEMLEHNISVSQIAMRHQVDKSYVSRVIRLRFLSPKIVQQILEGDQLPSLNARLLLGLSELPLDWRKQESELLAT